MKRLALAALLALIPSLAFADGTIDTLSPAAAIAGTESIPVFQTANPAVATTPNALDTYLSQTTKTLTNKTVNCADNTCTVRIANDVTGLGTGVATFLGTPSSANLFTALTTKTGSGGSAVFATGPTISGATGSGNWTFSGGVAMSGLSAGTQVSCLGLDGSNNVVLNAASCGTGSGGGGITALTGDGTASGSGSVTLTVSKIGGNALALGGALTFANIGTANQLLYASSANNVAGLATAASGVLVTSAGSVPSISTTLPDNLAMGTPASLTLTNATGLPVGSLTGLGTGGGTWLATPSGANLASALTTAIPVTKGGTGATSMTGHGVVTVNAGGTAQTTVAPGTTGNVLTSDGTDWISSAAGVSPLTSAHIFVGNASNAATDVALSGDATMANTGAITVTKSNGTSFGPLATQSFAATGGTNQVLKQLSTGGAITVGSINCAFISDASTGCSTTVGTIATQNASAVAITGGTEAGLTGLGIRDTSAAFDLTLAATSSTALTAGRTLTLDVKNVAHTLAFGNVANTITFPSTASYSVVGTGDTGTVTNTMLAGSITAAKLVQTDITSVGTITSGVWNGTAINPAQGGTGRSTLTAHDLIVGNGTSTTTLLAPSATSGIPLVSQGASLDPAYSTAVVAGGGTGLTSLTSHDLIIGNGTSAATLLAPSATSGVPLISQGASSDPAYGTTVVAGGGTGLTSLTAHDLIIGNGTSAATLLAPSATSGVPLISQGASADPVYGTVAVAGGGTGATSLAGNGAVVMNSGGTAQTVVAPSTSGNCMVSNGTAWTSATCTGAGVSVTAGTPNIVVNPSPGTGTFTVGTTAALNNQAGASAYTILSSDAGKTVNRTNTAGQSDVIPQATGSFTTGFDFNYKTGALSSGTQKLTATTSKINNITGSTGITLGAQQSADCFSDGTDWHCALGLPTPSVQDQESVLQDNMTWTAALKLGKSGTAGSVAMGNATSGVVTLQPVTGALGTVTASLPANTGTIAELNLAQAWSAAQTFTQVTETDTALSGCNGSTATMDLSLGTYFHCTVSAGAVTFAVSNAAASGKVSSFTLELTNPGSQTLTWMSGTKWPGGSQPSWTAAGVDLLVCSTRDGATTWRCVRGEADSK